MPASIRSYPFAVGSQENGKETPVIQYYINLFNSVARSKIKINEACSLFDDFGLIELFKAGLEILNRKIINFDGLLWLNEATFRELEEYKFLELQKTLAIEIAYAYFYSTNCFPLLVKLLQTTERSETELKTLG